jgi:hypothetical protein
MKGESSLNPHLIVASLSAPIAYIHCCKIVLMFYNVLQVGDSNFTDLKNETKWKIR